ncbi:hypothetical protein [Streptomyces sp. NBC_00859]|uniref:hypothetical protein n=1 Tax=Streptomyces sp. NBC_00859 TaxID=2903682 RepID=UPI0038659FF1|nr:hypothetical protein OG584_18635 [Streptomyces sp. NBC_00859]
MAVVRRTVTVAALCALGAAGLTACSGGDGPSSSDAFKGMSADKIADKGVAATKSADSLRVSGHMSGQGKVTDLDFAVDNSGTCTGRITAKDARADIVQAHKVIYLKGNGPYWQSAAKAQPGADADKTAKAFQGHWVKVPAQDSSVQNICNKQAFMAGMDQDKSERKNMTRQGTAEVDGQEAVVLRNKSGKGETNTLYVATHGKPYILKAVQSGGGAPSTVSFSDYNKRVKATAPPADEVVDPKKISAKAS